jgi:hypothetical protein
MSYHIYYNKEELERLGNCKYLNYLEQFSVWECRHPKVRTTTACKYTYKCAQCPLYDISGQTK